MKKNKKKKFKSRKKIKKEIPKIRLKKKKINLKKKKSQIISKQKDQPKKKSLFQPLIKAYEKFKEKRKIEMALEKNFPEDYSSKYSLVTFNEDIGYREAMLRGRAQDKAILNMLADGVISTEDDIKDILDKVKTETEAILEDDRIAGLH